MSERGVMEAIEHYQEVAALNRALSIAREEIERQRRVEAAAPALLAALVGCLPQLELGNGEAEHIKAARAAIALATGQEPT